MNFKNTCKSVASFVLGTGMMFSGLAFNNKSNALLPEEFYVENLNKYKDNPIMTEFLTLLRKVQDNSKELCGNVTDGIIPEARENIVEAQTKLEADTTKRCEVQSNINAVTKLYNGQLDLFNRTNQGISRTQTTLEDAAEPAARDWEERKLDGQQQAKAFYQEVLTAQDMIRAVLVKQADELLSAIYGGLRCVIKYLIALSIDTSDTPAPPSVVDAPKIVERAVTLHCSPDEAIALLREEGESLFGAETFNSIVSSKPTEHQ